MNKTILYSTQWYERRVHLGVLDFAQQHEWDVVSSHHMPNLVPDVAGVDGQIVEVGPRDRRRLRLIQEFDGPVVGIEDFGDGLDIPRVHTDNRLVGQLAARHLMDRGFRRFATLTRAEFQYVKDRLAGFRDEVAAGGATQCLDILWEGLGDRPTFLPGEQDAIRLNSLLKLDRPVGVFCVDDEDARILVRHLERHEIAVPEEVAVIGVNNDPLICPYASVPISSVDPGFEQVGYRAAELLNQMLEGETVPPATHTIQPLGVVVRRSSDIRAVDDVQVARALRYIWDHADRRIAIGDIAAHVDLPVRTLQWRFSKRMGNPLQEELTRSRINRVKQELLHTTKSANQIAQDLDFSSVQYMIRVFNKETGLSPLKYRRAHEGGIADGSGGVAPEPAPATASG